MTTITELAQVIQRIFASELPNQIAREVGFMQRQRKVSGASFLATMVLFWLGKSDESTWLMSRLMDRVGLAISRQGLTQRFTAEAVVFMETMLERVVEEVVTAKHTVAPILQQFSHINLMDSTVISLPDSLHHLWSGCGTVAGKTAALKVMVEWDMKQGGIKLQLMPGSSHDLHTDLIDADWRSEDSLSLRDLGFFKLAVFAKQAAKKQLFLSRYKTGTMVLNEQGKPLPLLDLLRSLTGDYLDKHIQLGQKQRLVCRLVAFRVPEAVVQQRRARLRETAKRKGQKLSAISLELAAWTIFVTNASSSQLATAQVALLARYRWQIELLFKLWKSELQVDTWVSHNPHRILCEVYAKLIAGVVQNWLLVLGCSQLLDRSLLRASKLIRQYAWELAGSLQHWDRLVQVLHDIMHGLQHARMDKSRHHPPTFQLFLDYDGLN